MNFKPENFVQLKRLFNRIILSACKCRKKLAHESCFNKYIDLRQSGNVKIQLACQQCNLKYEFSYPYNGSFIIIRSLIRRSLLSFNFEGYFLRCFAANMRFDRQTFKYIQFNRSIWSNICHDLLESFVIWCCNYSSSKIMKT